MKSALKMTLFWGTAVLILTAVNIQIARKETILREGRVMLLALAPVDPRSLMQGDYMLLRYAIADSVSSDQLDMDGHIVVTLDERQIASFARLSRGEPLVHGEYLLRYRNRGGLRLGAESYFFQEGAAERYERARYAELRVTDSGESVLVGLRNENLQPPDAPRQ